MRGLRRRLAGVRRAAVAPPLLALAAPILGLAALASGCASDSREPAAPRVVSVLGTGSERATGFVAGPGTVVTVAHALAGRESVRVRLDRGHVRPARVVARYARLDLALLAVPGLPGIVPRTASTGSEDRVRVVVVRGRRVVTMAAAVRRAIDAHVSAPGAERALSRPALELEARLRAGDSGAPVLTEGGDLAGVLFARSRNNADTAYAVDALALARLLDAARRPQHLAPLR